MATRADSLRRLKRPASACMGLLMALCAASMRASSPPPSPRADDTATLQSKVDALPDGGVLNLEARTYICNDLKISKSITITGAGTATILTRTTAEPVLRLSGAGKDVQLSGMTIDGAKLPAIGVMALGLRLLKMNKVQVQYCGIPLGHSIQTDSQGSSVDGVYASGVETAQIDHCAFNENLRDGFIAIPVKHLLFTNNSCVGDGRMGCTSDRDRTPHGKGGPLSVVYENNLVSNCGTGGLHVESSPDNPVVDARFDNNTVRNCGDLDWGYNWGIIMGNNCKGLIRGNTVEGVGLNSKLDKYRSGIIVGGIGGAVTLYKNVVRHTGLAGITINACKFPVQVRDSRIQYAGGDGISIYGSNQVSVQGCTIDHAQKNGIWVRLSPGAEFTGNTILNNSQAKPKQFSGIRAELSPNLTVTTNLFEANDQKVGIELDNAAYAPGMSFVGNTIGGSRQHPLLSNFKQSN